MTNDSEVIKQESENRTPGQILRDERGKSGLTQQQVAERLHLRIGDIQDIEADTHKKGLSITFTKGYVRIYAKLLNLPIEPLLVAFDELHKGEKQPAKLQSFSQRVAKQANDDRWMLVTYVMLTLVILSVVIWWFQQSDESIGSAIDRMSNGVVEQVKNLNGPENNIDTTEGTEIDVFPTPTQAQRTNAELNNNGATTPDTDLGVDNASLLEKVNAEQSVVNDSLNSVVDDTTDSLPRSTIDNEPLNSSATTDASNNASTEVNSDELLGVNESNVDTLVDDVSSTLLTSAGQTYSMNADGTVDLAFTFKDDCWVSVKDANGETMAVGVKTKGRVMPVSGIPPISIILGAPQSVDISFGGAQVNMSVYEPGRTANFTLPIEGE